MIRLLDFKLKSTPSSYKFFLERLYKNKSNHTNNKYVNNHNNTHLHNFNYNLRSYFQSSFINKCNSTHITNVYSKNNNNSNNNTNNNNNNVDIKDIINKNNNDLIEYTKKRSLTTLSDKEKEILLYKFIKNMNELKIDLQSNKFIIAAISGGADSMALCFLLKGWCNKHGLTLVAVTIDHGLTPPSEDIVAISENIRKIDQDIQHIVIKIDWIGNGPPTTSLLQALRRRRYEILCQVANRFHSNSIFIGSNNNDQIETFLHRLQYGSGIEGLAGMQPSLPLSDLFIYRPLLNIDKDELFGLCNAYNIRYTHDVANNLTTFERNRIRLGLSKLCQQDNSSDNDSNNNNNSQIIQQKEFNSVISSFRDFRNIIQEQVSQFLSEIKNDLSLEFPMFKINMNRFQQLSDPIGCRVLYQLSMILSGEYQMFRHQEFTTLYRSILNGETKTLNHIFFYKYQNHLYIHPETLSRVHTNNTIIDTQLHLRKASPIKFGHYTLKFSKLTRINSSNNKYEEIQSKNNNNNNKNINSIINNNNDNNNNSNKNIIQSLKLHSIRYYNPKTDERYIGKDIKSLNLPKLARTLIPVVVNEKDQVLSIPHLSIWNAPRQYNISITLENINLNYKSDTLL